MIITKKDAKQVRYVAKANGKAEYTGNGNTKHRIFYATGVEFDETAVDKDRIEISNIVKHGVPFEGTLSEFWDWVQVTANTVDAGTITQDKITPGHEDIVDAVKMAVKHQTNVTEPEKVTILVPNEPHPVEVNPVPVDTDPLDQLEETSVDDILSSLNREPEEPEEPAVSSVWQDTKEPDFSVEVAPPVDEPVEVIPMVATSETAKDMSVEAELVGEPRNFIPKDATLQDAEVVEPPKKELTQPELHALRTELAVRKLARSYGESEGATLPDIVMKHPDAMDRLNGIFSADGITPYTMTEDSIRKSYEE